MRKCTAIYYFYNSASLTRLGAYTGIGDLKLNILHENLQTNRITCGYLIIKYVKTYILNYIYFLGFECGWFVADVTLSK